MLGEQLVDALAMRHDALQERIDALEARVAGLPSSGGAGTPSHAASRSALLPSGRLGSSPTRLTGRRDFSSEPWADDFDPSHAGMWSVVLTPVTKLTRFLWRIISFLLYRNPSASSAVLILRRLLLDISFVLCVFLLARRVWRRSGVRRREVFAALQGVWGALVGSNIPQRLMADKAV